MKKLTGLMLSFIIGVSLVLTGVDDAHAKRMGGGRSFGSKPSYSEPYRSSNSMNQTAPSQPAFQSRATQQNQMARESLSRRGGLMGMLGGLALGGLLGSMLFGGAFEHINFVDILLFAGIAFILFKLFAARRQPTMGQAGAATAYSPTPQPEAHDYGYERQQSPISRPPASSQRAGFDTDLLAAKGGAAAAIQSHGSAIPADFDEQAFMSGAKAAYVHLQEAWDRSDLADLRGLTTDKVFAELQEQLRDRVGENRTELLSVDSRLLEVRDVGNDREVAVLFDVSLREAPQEAPVQVREIWHFVRSKFSKQPTWFLDGIQQLEE